MSAVLVQGATGEWFHISVRVLQGCLLSPILFNIFLEDIMTHSLENYNGTVRIGVRKITNLRFADAIDGITGEEDELTKLVHNLDTAAATFGTETSSDKSKIMTKNGTLQRDITIQEQTLETLACRFHIYSLNCRYLQLKCTYLQFNWRYLQIG